MRSGWARALRLTDPPSDKRIFRQHEVAESPLCEKQLCYFSTIFRKQFVKTLIKAELQRRCCMSPQFLSQSVQTCVSVGFV